jgi:hypothetical protein
VVGETTREPLNGTVSPFRSALTSLLVVHVNVELLPTAMDVGLAVIEAVGGPPDETVTVAWADAVVPEEPVATKL